jgi:hypothetical protein
MDQDYHDYDETDPPVWPRYVSAIMLPFVVAIALVAVGFVMGFLIHVGASR